MMMFSQLVTSLRHGINICYKYDYRLLSTNYMFISMIQYPFNISIDHFK